MSKPVTVAQVVETIDEWLTENWNPQRITVLERWLPHDADEPVDRLLVKAILWHCAWGHWSDLFGHLPIVFVRRLARVVIALHHDGGAGAFLGSYAQDVLDVYLDAHLLDGQ